MNDIVIRPAYREDFEIISKLIADQNKLPATHCIQSETSEDYQGIQREMTGLDLSSALRLAVAFQTDRLIGALGCELDEELGRGWLRGPFAVCWAGRSFARSMSWCSASPRPRCAWLTSAARRVTSKAGWSLCGPRWSSWGSRRGRGSKAGTSPSRIG